MSAKHSNKQILSVQILNNNDQTNIQYIYKFINELGIKIIGLEDNYKIIEKFDTHCNYIRLKNYQNMKNYFGIKKEVFKNELDIQTVYKQYQNLQILSEVQFQDIVVQIKDILIDKNSVMYEEKIHIWFIFQDVEYMLYNNYYISNIHFSSKHVLKHYEEKEVFKILQDMIQLINTLQQKSKRVNFWNFFVCYKDNQYKFVLLDVQDIQKDQVLENVFSDQMKLVALIIYGLMKELIGAFYHFNPENTKQLVNLFQTGRLQGFQQSINLIIEILARKDKIEQNRIQEQQNYLQQNIEKYLDILFVFKDEEIFLANQPIFKYAKKMSFSISRIFDKKEEAFDLIVRKLKESEKLQDLTLKFGECCLSVLDIQKTVSCFKNFQNLKHLYLDFKDSQLDDENVSNIMQNLAVKNIESITLIFSNTLITKKSYKIILDKISQIPDDQLLTCELELIQKEQFKKQSNKNKQYKFSKSIQIQIETQNFQFEFWIVNQKAKKQHKRGF